MMSGGPSLVQRLANIQHMPVLIAATVASDKPIDGFLIKDVIKMSFESSQTRVFLQQYLLNMLVTSSNVFVKIKVLRLLLALVEEGHIEFKQNLRKQPEPLNEAAKLRAIQPRDQKLMAECGRIRDMANRVLDNLYMETPELRPRSTIHHHSQTEERGSSRITGFGNTPPPEKPTGPSTTEKILKVISGSRSPRSQRKAPVYDPSYATMDPVPHNRGTNSPYTPQISSMTYSPGRFMEGPLPVGADHVSGKAGGGWGEENGNSDFRKIRVPATRTETREESPQDGDSELLSSLEETSTEQERKLVDDITAPGGVRAAPPRESLTVFINRCKFLDCQAVVEYLRQKLQSEETQIVLRALFVLEALLRSDIPDTFSLLDLTLDELHSLSSSPHNSIKAKATKILRQLTLEVDQRASSPEVTTGVVTMATTNQNAARTGNILDLEEGGTEEEQLPEMAEEVPSENSDLAGIFVGMDVSGIPIKTSSGVKKKAKPVQQVKPVKPEIQVSRPTEKTDLIDALPTSSEKPRDRQSSAEPSIGQEESLVDFGQDEDEDDFDPLKPSNLSTQTEATSTSPSRQQENGDIINQLSSLNLSSDLKPSEGQQTMPSLSEILQPVQTGPPMSQPQLPIGSQPAPVYASGVATMQMPAGPMVGLQQMAYVPAHAYGMAPGAAPGMMVNQQGVPMMYTAAPGMVYMTQPMAGKLGGDARPVQRPPPSTKEQTPPLDSSFGFLGKSNKSSAFDFVQEEMASHMKK